MTSERKRTILALDDDDVNLMILVKNAEEAGFDVRSFSSGEAAWHFLVHNPNAIDIALLDKMMPGINGMELLGNIKRHPALRHIPVILQTGDVGITQMREGLESGAYYYLTKPFHPEILTAILHAANNECALRDELLAQVATQQDKFMGLMQEGEFAVRTHAEARILAAGLSQGAERPEFVARGLMELLANAIEHGSLGIGYEMKANCLLNRRWLEELMHRASLPEAGDRVVRVQVQRVMSGLHIRISDEGRGFDWQHFLEKSGTVRLNKPNGRGISIARGLLQDLQYNDKGNEVNCTIPASTGNQPGSAKFTLVPKGWTGFASMAPESP